MIKINKEKCIGCGVCVSICEKVFELRDDMKAYVKKAQEKAKDACVKEAIEGCPVQAITL